jgi:hypothetical protein
MADKLKYFNAFFIIIVLVALVGIFKYFFYEVQEKNIFNSNSHKKYLNKNYIDHVLYVPDNYYFLQIKRIDSFNHEYNLLIHKLFTVISESMKYNISTITMNFISLTDLALMSEMAIQDLINNKKLWKLIEKYAKKMNVKINFIYDELVVNKDLIEIFKFLTHITSSQKCYTQVNFIVGYDLFNDVKKNLINLILVSKNKEELLSQIKNLDIEKFLLYKIPPIDLAIIFNNAAINDNLLLHMTNCKIVNLNYSLDKITKKIIHILLKELLFNEHPFV